jgi:hypothetical protein
MSLNYFRDITLSDEHCVTELYNKPVKIPTSSQRSIVMLFSLMVFLVNVFKEI